MEDVAPENFYLDYLIDYAAETNLTLEAASALMANYAKQRVPEYQVERKVSELRRKVRSEIDDSPSEELIVRVLVRTRIHSISWQYFPKYHVVGSPFQTHWYSVRYREPVWKTFTNEGMHYIDDLFYDSKWEQFWMPEPYLSEMPESLALYNHLTQEKLPVIEGTSYRKVDPRIVEGLLKTRRNTPIFKRRRVGGQVVLRTRKPYGSDGWEDRIKVISPYRRIRK